MKVWFENATRQKQGSHNLFPSAYYFSYLIHLLFSDNLITGLLVQFLSPVLYSFTARENIERFADTTFLQNSVVLKTPLSTTAIPRCVWFLSRLCQTSTSLFKALRLWKQRNELKKARGEKQNCVLFSRAFSSLCHFSVSTI